MRIFTLGKNGITLFFFAFILFSGTSMYGQCPTTSATPANQNFCYLQTVGDIETDGNAVYQTDDNTNDTQPIPEDELLTNGVTYYVGGTSGDCDRIAVTVTVEVVERPTNTIFPNSSSFEITPCSSTNFTADDLAGYFQPTLPNYEVEVYTTQFGTTVAVGELTPGASYFVGQVSTDPDDCPSLRAAVGYNPIDPNPPTATSPQVFCAGATVADLVAEGTYDNTQAIRWYRSENANSPLPENTVLLNGQTYYATQIVNDRNDPFPPCESDERRPVTIEITPVPFSGNFPLEFCVTDAKNLIESPEDAIDYFTTLLAGEEVILDPANFEGNALAEVESLLDFIENPDSETETFNFIYNNPSTNPECEDGEITIDVTINNAEEADAGDFAMQTVCSSDGMIDLTGYIAAAGATPGGTFTGEGVENNMFDASLGSQTGGYAITYTVVDSEDDCVTGEPSSQFTINVQNAPVSGNVPLNFCIAEAQEIVQEPADAEDYIITLLENRGVNVNPLNFADGDAQELERLYNYIQTPTLDSETFNFTYTTPANGVCEEGVINIAVTINDAEEADAGDFAIQTVCSSDGMIDLTGFIAAAGATPGGTFTGEGVENNMFDASLGSQTGGYAITYTVVDSEDDCVTGEPSSQFTITVDDAPLSGNIPLNFCVTEAQEIVQVPADAEDYISGILEDRGVDVDLTNFAEGDAEELGRLYSYIQNPTGDSETFNFTYNNPSESNLCEDGVITIDVTINNVQEADAGEIGPQIVCSADGMVDLTQYLEGSGATLGGNFSGEGVENNMFDTSMGANENGYLITYTVGGGSDCTIGGPTSSQFTITVLEGGEAGEDNLDEEVCRNTLPAQVTANDVRNYLLGLLSSDATTGGTFSNISQITADFNALSSFPTIFTTVYTVGQGTDCESIATLEVTILGSPDAGSPGQLTIAADDTEPKNLFAELEGTPDAGGTWTFDDEEVDGTFDPATDEEGVYTYTVTAENGCPASATVTVTVGTQSGTCPEVTEAQQTFCSANPTVANLQPTSAIWYADADTTEPLNATTPLEDEMIYYAGNAEGTCDVRATVTVTIAETPDAPTLAPGGNIFCEETDNPTIASLSNNIIGNDGVIWYSTETGGETYSSSERLQDGMTYYASFTDEEALCEGLRLAVTVEFDCPFILPEAFSPNGDGINDAFKLENLVDDYPNFGMEIYNRWGDKVFIGNSSNLRWDGTSSESSLGNGVLPVGVYFYILNYNDGQTAPIQGKVYLSR